MKRIAIKYAFGPNSVFHNYDTIRFLLFLLSSSLNETVFNMCSQMDVGIPKFSALRPDILLCVFMYISD